jgi:hypothetical protein
MALLATSVAVGSLILGGMALSSYMNIEKPDDNYCYARPDQQKVAVFVDNSLRQQSEAQFRDYSTAFERAYNSAEPNALLTVFSTAADTNRSLATPVFTICKPASTPAEQAAINAPEKPAPYLARQSKEAKARYEAAVEEILLDAQDADKIANDSPILEQLRAISMTNIFAGDNRQLTVITDGFQNSEIAKFCEIEGNMPSFASFKERSDYNLTIKPRSFAGIDVKLLLVEIVKLPDPVHYPFCTLQEKRNWWVSYFEGNDADSVELTPIRYWGGRS